MQGRHDKDMWIKKVRIEYSLDGKEWNILKSKEEDENIFKANTDRDTIKKIDLPSISQFPYVFNARQIRIYPEEWNEWPCLRLDFLFRSS